MRHSSGSCVNSPVWCCWTSSSKSCLSHMSRTCWGLSILPKVFSCNLLSAGRKLMLKASLISAQGKVALCSTQLATRDFQLHCHFSDLIRCLCLSLCVPSPSCGARSACSTMPLRHEVWVCLLRALLQGSNRCVGAEIHFTSCSAVLLCAANRGRISPLRLLHFAGEE